MAFYKFIKTRGLEGRMTGYFVPRMYHISFDWQSVKAFGLPYVLDRLNGWTVWWVDSEEDFTQAIKRLDELKKTRIFDYVVGK